MSIEPGDIATWSGVAVSLAFSAAALIVSIRSLRHARRSADAAERQAIAAEQALPPPPPPIGWVVQHINRSRYALRNTGTRMALGVDIDPDRNPAVVFDEDGPVDIRPGATWTFLIAATMGTPHPPELWVTWDGQRDPVPVPVPPR